MGVSWLFKPIAAGSAIALSTLGLLSRKYQRAKFYLNLTLYCSALATLSVCGVLISIGATLIGQRLNINYVVARSFYYTCGPLISWKIDVEGEEHLQNLLTARDGKEQSAVLVGNHQSFIDILYLGRIFPKRASIMAKNELKWTPLLGQYLATSGAVFVNRKDRKHAVQALEQAGEDMKKRGVSLWIFPEGTRSLAADPILLPFKKGAFHLAVQAQVPIVPVVCENYHRLFDGKTRMDSGNLKIKVLPPISTIGMTAEDVGRLTEHTHDIMEATLQSISAPGPTSSQSQPKPKTKPIPSDNETPRAEKPNPILAAQDSLRQRNQEGSNTSDEGDRVIHLDIGSELRSVDSRGGETTEDEMDEDAVLLKRPDSKEA